jgi:hypothetical protein
MRPEREIQLPFRNPAQRLFLPRRSKVLLMSLAVSRTLRFHPFGWEAPVNHLGWGFFYASNPCHRAAANSATSL